MFLTVVMEILLDHVHHPISLLVSINATKAVVHGDLRMRKKTETSEQTATTVGRFNAVAVESLIFG